MWNFSHIYRQDYLRGVIPVSSAYAPRLLLRCIVLKLSLLSVSVRLCKPRSSVWTDPVASSVGVCGSLEKIFGSLIPSTSVRFTTLLSLAFYLWGAKKFVCELLVPVSRRSSTISMNVGWARWKAILLVNYYLFLSLSILINGSSFSRSTPSLLIPVESLLLLWKVPIVSSSLEESAWWILSISFWRLCADCLLSSAWFIIWTFLRLIFLSTDWPSSLTICFSLESGDY